MDIELELTKAPTFQQLLELRIRATASGTVTNSSYTRSNGNYVKIKAQWDLFNPISYTWIKEG